MIQKLIYIVKTIFRRRLNMKKFNVKKVQAIALAAAMMVGR